MESFTLKLPTNPLTSAFGRNALLRASDRIEAIGIILAVLVTIVAIPVAAAYGTSVHERLAIRDAQYAASLHRVPATVTGTVVPRQKDAGVDFYSTPVHWVYAGRDGRGVVDWPDRLHNGDEITIWVDESGALSTGPAPPDRAASGAVALAVTAWLLVAESATVLTLLLRWWLDVQRGRLWERQLTELVDGGNHHCG